MGYGLPGSIEKRKFGIWKTGCGYVSLWQSLFPAFCWSTMLTPVTFKRRADILCQLYFRSCILWCWDMGPGWISLWRVIGWKNGLIGLLLLFGWHPALWYTWWYTRRIIEKRVLFNSILYGWTVTKYTFLIFWRNVTIFTLIFAIFHLKMVSSYWKILQKCNLKKCHHFFEEKMVTFLEKY